MSKRHPQQEAADAEEAQRLEGAAPADDTEALLAELQTPPPDLASARSRGAPIGAALQVALLVADIASMLGANLPDDSRLGGVLRKLQAARGAALELLNPPRPEAHDHTTPR